MIAQWEVGAVVSYESQHGDAVLLVVESEPGGLERALVLWGDGSYEEDVGGAFVWTMDLGVATRIT